MNQAPRKTEKCGRSLSTDKTTSVAGDEKRSDSYYIGGLALRRSAVVETFAFLGIFVVANVLLGDGSRFIAQPLHPFWLIVLLVSVQYGPREAMMAAVVSTLFLLVGNLPEQSLSETMYGYIWRISRTPLMWLMAALIMGNIRGRQIVERDDLAEQLQRVNEISSTIVEDYKTIKQSKERLELRLAEDRQSVLTVYEAACALETMDVRGIQEGIERLVSIALSPQKFSLFFWDHDVLRRRFDYGWNDDDSFADTLDKTHTLTAHIRATSDVVCVADEDGERILDGQGILAGAIVDPASRKSYGMLKIEEIGFTDLDIRTSEIFRILCQWIARVYAKAEAHGVDVKSAHLKKKAY